MPESPRLSQQLRGKSSNAKVNENTSQSARQDDTSNMAREYEFFVSMDEPHQPEGVERGMIRRLVMRNFFETKSAGPQPSTSENNSASTVMAKQQLKSRFRLPKPAHETKAKRRDSKQEQGVAKRKRPRTTRTFSGATDTSELSESGKSLASSPKQVSTEEEGQSTEIRDTEKQGRRLVLKIDPGAHRLDPFDVLPIPGTPQLDVLFKLYKSGSKKNSIAVNAGHGWWSFISNDAGLLHATLATWALYGMLTHGLMNLRVDKLRHKNEAIKQINSKIGSPGSKITDELVGTVLTMASFENLVGAYDAAQLHIAALKRMINARGGLFAFGHNDGLIRGIIWVDFHTATAFHTPPSFSHIRLDPDTPPLPDRLLEEAACTSPTSFLRLSLAAIDCFNIFYRLHRLSLAVSSHWIDRVNRLTLSNLLYETEFTILSVPDYSRNFLHFDLEVDEEPDEEWEERRHAADSACVVEALLAACQIFLYAALRDVPTNAKLFGILLERVRVAVARPGVDTVDIWRREHNLPIFLWVCVTACSVAPQGDGRAFWIAMLAKMNVEVGVTSRFELEMALRRVAWVDVYFNAVVGSVWEEVVQLRDERVMQR